jgi:hypothetical protein
MYARTAFHFKVHPALRWGSTIHEYSIFGNFGIPNWDVLILASFELQVGTPQSGHSSLCLTTLSKYF